MPISIRLCYLSKNLWLKLCESSSRFSDTVVTSIKTKQCSMKNTSVGLHFLGRENLGG